MGRPACTTPSVAIGTELGGYRSKAGNLDAVLHRDIKPYDMPTPGIGASDHGDTLKDYAMIHGAKSSLTLEAPGSISYMDQVLGQAERLHEIVNQARVAVAGKDVCYKRAPWPPKTTCSRRWRPSPPS